MKVPSFAVAAVIAAMSSVAHGAEDQLYPPPPPPGAASVRVLDVRSVPAAASVTIGEKTINASVPPSTFQYVNQGVVTIKSPGVEVSKAVHAGNFYTLFVGNKTNVLFQEERPPLTQALVVLYNLSLLDGVTLKTEDGATEVISAQSRFKVRSQTVNPIKTGFAVYVGGKKIGAVPSVQLRQGTSFGVMVLGPKSNPRLISAAGPSLVN